MTSSLTVMPNTLQAILVELVRVNTHVIKLEKQVDELRTDERKRFDDLIKTTLKLSLDQRYPHKDPTQDVANHLVGLGMFDEVPIGHEEGYKLEELEIDTWSNEGGNANARE